jgi:hypothetical protein
MLMQLLLWDNASVHRAAANDVDFKTRDPRGSVCNGLLSDVLGAQQIIRESYPIRHAVAIHSLVNGGVASDREEVSFVCFVFGDTQSIKNSCNQFQSHGMVESFRAHIHAKSSLDVVEGWMNDVHPAETVKYNTVADEDGF